MLTLRLVDLSDMSTLQLLSSSICCFLWLLGVSSLWLWIMFASLFWLWTSCSLTCFTFWYFSVQRFNFSAVEHFYVLKPGFCVLDLSILQPFIHLSISWLLDCLTCCLFIAVRLFNVWTARHAEFPATALLYFCIYFSLSLFCLLDFYACTCSVWLAVLHLDFSTLRRCCQNPGLRLDFMHGQLRRAQPSHILLPLSLSSRLPCPLPSFIPSSPISCSNFAGLSTGSWAAHGPEWALLWFPKRVC